MTRPAWCQVGLLLVALGTAAWRRAVPVDPQAEVMGGNVVAALSDAHATAGFARAFKPRPFHFPADSGPHPAFQTEWWYYTGNLHTSTGRHLGYQLTFFRRSLTARPVQRLVSLAGTDVWFAHFALTDTAGGRFQAFERWSRGGGGLAGASASPYRVWLEDWQVAEDVAESERSQASDALLHDGQVVRATAALGPVVRLSARDQGAAIELTLAPTRPRVAQGDNGLSQKGLAAGNASYYYSQTRLRTTGTATSAGTAHQVRGSSWLDREWSTSALDADLEGWDWFALHLGDGRDLMLYRLRRKDGSSTPCSAGTVIDPHGPILRLSLADFTITALGQWESPQSGVRYPLRWRVRVPRAGIDVELTPRRLDQELPLSFYYWEGAVRSSDGGEGYVELTGYPRAKGR